jgi:hypothetical protein
MMIFQRVVHASQCPQLTERLSFVINSKLNPRQWMVLQEKYRTVAVALVVTVAAQVLRLNVVE